MEATAIRYNDILTYDELRATAKQPLSVCVSIFLATQPTERTHQRSQIQLGNLLRQAEHLLAARGFAGSITQDVLSPAWQLGDDIAFWTHQSAGLAVFVAPELFRVYRLPIAFEQLVVADTSPHIVPLLPLLQDDGRFFVLALGLDGVQLWCASHYSFSAVPLPGIPASLNDALKYDQFAKQAQFHPGIPGRGGERGAIFHGHGALDDQLAKEEISRYFQQVDRGVHAALHDQHAPLVLAGLGYLVPIYRAANSYPHLIDAGILCNPRDLSHADLHAQAWALVAPYFERERVATVARYRLLASTQPNQATNYLRTIVPAAAAGRIATLFVAAGQCRWGRFDPGTGVLTLHQAAEQRGAELINFAATQSILHGGNVYITTPTQLPEAAPLAAIFRY